MSSSKSNKKNVTVIPKEQKAIFCAKGHPKTFLKINKKTQKAVCPYCSHIFIYE